MTDLNHDRSRAAMERGRKLLPGGVDSPVRAYKGVGGDPVVLASGLGAIVTDIDGNDYWVWQRLDACSPRIVVLEFNAAFGPDRSVTVPYDPAFNRGAFAAVTRKYYGASLAAFERLGREKGYRLVLVEPRGVNAYFLRDDVGPDVPSSPAATIHPDPTMDTQPLFDLLAREGLSLVDLETQD